jgi:Fe2+ transport system protein FeoA
MSSVATLPIALTSLSTGQTARFYEARLDTHSVGLLRALGLSETQPFRVCKVGEPCILQVDGTRIGVSRVVARNLYVIPDTRAV